MAHARHKLEPLSFSLLSSQDTVVAYFARTTEISIRKMWAVYVFLVLVGTSCVSAQSQCQCGGFLTRPGYSEWFYSFLQFFQEDCLALLQCKNDCYNYLYNLTNGGDLTTIIPSEQLSVGDLICKQINRDIPTDTTVEFEFQLCESDWYNTDLNTTYPFCCIGGQYPDTVGCPII